MYKSFFIGLSLMITNLICAQTMSLGPELGINLIQIEKQEIGNNYQPGWYGGLTYDYKVNNWLSIRTGLYYSQSRQAFSSADTSLIPILDGIIDSSMLIPGLDLNTYTTVNGRQLLHYLQIPIQANFTWKKIQFGVGGYVGFLVGANQKQTTIERTPLMSTFDFSSIDSTGFLSMFLPPAYQETNSESTGTNDLRIFDYGLKGSIGYQMDQVGVRASYSIGLPDYRTKKEGAVVRNKFFQFSVYYLFPTKGNSGASSI